MRGKYFSEKELACPCCGENGVTQELVSALDELREKAGVPIIVHDAFRCQKHNAEAGGVPNSEHPRGEAADIAIPGKTDVEMYWLANSVSAFADGGIGIYDFGHFIHVDVRGRRARWSRIGGKYAGFDELFSRWTPQSKGELNVTG